MACRMSSRYSRRKGKDDNITNELYKDSCNEDSAARTRPFSFDEIMLRRKIKKLSGGLIDVKDSTGGPSDLLKEVIDDPDRFKSKCHRRNEESPLAAEKCASEMSMRSCVSKKEGTFLKEEKVSNSNSKNNCGSENKVKVKTHDDVSYRAKKFRFEIQSHIRKKISELSTDDSGNESREKPSRDFVVNDRYEYKSKKKSEYELKRKHRCVYEDKIRDRRSATINPRKWHNLEFSGRDGRGEFQRDGNEESRAEQKHYRSHKLSKRRDRYGSVSPRECKSTSYHGRDSEKLSSQTIKKRREKQNFDIDRSKISGNGSSSNYRRHGVPASGLGGYSPRKRKSEAAVKTPSPIKRSPEKKNVGWDLPPGTQNNLPILVISNADSSNQHPTSSMNEMTSVVPVNINAAIPSGSSHNTSPSLKGVSVDSIQLTQATRPLRRIYVENVPASASEKSLMECLNKFLLSRSNSHILGTQPCISCIMQKERGHAFVEFMTPEDASAALSFDGSSFLGSILKIRRPKDFVEVTTDVQDKSATAVDVMLGDTVIDSPHKIFIGGISEVLSSEMIMEIATAFGPLKAYTFQTEDSHNGPPSAFLEYVDPSVTVKACAGLNGLKLGGKILTVVQALPNTSKVVENPGSPPFYGIPEHAKPLLESPTQILNLKNVVDPEMLSTLSEAELEEILGDIRLECGRFGAIKALNLVKLNHREDSGLEMEGDPKSIEEHKENRDRKSESENENELKEGVCMERHCPKNSELEKGCVVVEYRRSESCCWAAHSLHGRVFGDRIVSASYVANDVYKARFPSPRR